LGGLVSVHAGRKSNSIEVITNAEVFKQQLKQDMLCGMVDFLEVGSVKDIDGYRQKVFPAIGKRLPIIIGSDNHNPLAYHRKAPCWLKADLTFDGLRHVLHEPDERVSLQDVPASDRRVADNPTKYIDSITIRRKAESTLAEHWFDCQIPINAGLVAVIGNKGSGKSALADIVGFLGDSSNGKYFSFLEPNRFRHPKSNKSNHFDATIRWRSGGDFTRCLGEAIREGTAESVRYLPQSYLEKICDGMEDAKAGVFSKELKAVIFSHIGTTDRLWFDNLDDLLSYKTESAAEAIARLRNDLRAQVAELVKLESHATASHRLSVEQNVATKQRELDAHLASPPPKRDKPENNPEIQAGIGATQAEIEQLTQSVSEFEGEIATLTENQVAEARRVLSADRLLGRIKNLQSEVEAFRQSTEEDFEEVAVSIDDVISFSVNVEKIEAARTVAIAERDRIANVLSAANPSGVTKQLADKKLRIANLTKTLDLPNQQYQQSLEALANWERRRTSIEGDEETPDTLLHFKKQLADLDALPELIEAAYEGCIETAVKIHEHLVEISAEFKSLYKPVQDFIETHPLADDHFHLSFEAAIVDTGFTTELLGFINHSKAGTFCGIMDGKQTAENLVKQATFSTGEGIRAFLKQVITCLRNDTREGKNRPIQIHEQLLKGRKLEALLECVFELQYLEPSHTLRWANKEISELSPGERGTLLLVFYLLIDQSDIPLIIDQPEENLDNQTVYDVLVPSIKEAKVRRQIIMVTHNPNLAVVCDADQIIYASLDKDKGNRVTYQHGSIENIVVNQKLVDILEGTWPAFDNRERKYIRSSARTN
jgi:ABC-type lipoprotein export system ATPase subunit